MLKKFFCEINFYVNYVFLHVVLAHAFTRVQASCLGRVIDMLFVSCSDFFIF